MLARVRVLLCIAAALLTLGATAADAQDYDDGGGPIVVVAPSAIVNGEVVRLGEIATVEAENPADRVRLEAIQLGYAPAVGAVREITHDRIVAAIAVGFPRGGVMVESPEVVVVRREAQEIDPDLIHAAVERAALARFADAGVTARLVRLDVPHAGEVPSGKLEVDASALGARDLLAPFSVQVELRVDGRVVRRLTATAQVEAYAPVLVTARNIPANGRVRAGDVRTEIRRLEKSLTSYVRDPESLRGVAASRPVTAGQPLTTDTIVSAVVVKSGDAVRISGVSGALTVTATGEARSAGRIGDRIQVKNSQSGVLLQAVIADEGHVVVTF